MNGLNGIYESDFNEIKKYVEKAAAPGTKRDEAIESLRAIYIEAQENGAELSEIRGESAKEYAKEICDVLPAKKKTNKKPLFAGLIIIAIAAAVAFAAGIFNKREEPVDIVRTENYDIYGEKVAYLYDDKLMLDVTFENTGNTTLYLSFSTEIWHYSNGRWDLWLDEQNYSGGVQAVLPSETTNFFGTFDLSGKLSSMVYENCLFKIKREVFRYSGSEIKESIGFAEWIFDIESYEGIAAIGEIKSELLPHRDNMPKDSVFANEEQAEYVEKLIDEINYERIINFAAVSYPNDVNFHVEIPRNEAIKIIQWLQEMELVACEPKNPNTGGGYSFYIETFDENIAIGTNGGFFEVWIEGEKTAYIFDETDECREIFGTMWNIAGGILEEAYNNMYPETKPKYELKAFVSNEFEGGGKYFPSNSELPNGIEWGDEKIANTFQKFINSLDAGSIRAFMAAFTPAGDSGKTVSINKNMVSELLELLKKVEIVPGKPQNPTTTGGVAIYIHTGNNDYVVISSDLNSLCISMKGMKTNYYFSAEDCSDEIWNIMLAMDEMINNEEDIGKIGSNTEESYLIPNNLKVVTTLFSNKSKTAAESHLGNELRELLIYQNLTINPNETDSSALGNPLPEVDVIEFIREDDGTKYTLTLYEKGFVLSGSAVPEGKRGQQWIVEENTWNYFKNKINSEFEDADYVIPYWFGLVSSKRVKEVVVFGSNGEKYKYTKEDDSFDNFFSILKSDIKVSYLENRFNGNEISETPSGEYIRLKIYFETGTIYEILAERNYITMVSSDMSYGLRYVLEEKSDAYDAFLDYAFGGPINAVTG